MWVSWAGDANQVAQCPCTVGELGPAGMAMPRLGHAKSSAQGTKNRMGTWEGTIPT